MSPALNFMAMQLFIATLVKASTLPTKCVGGTGSCTLGQDQHDETSLLQVKKGVSPGSKRTWEKSNQTPSLSDDKSMPSGIDFYPDKPITAEMLRKANYEAFVKEIIDDEDKNIKERANLMVKRLATVQKSRQEIRKAASLRSASERNKAAEEISRKVEEASQKISKEAMDAGRKAQKAEDKVAMQELKNRLKHAEAGLHNTTIKVEALKAHVEVPTKKEASAETQAAAPKAHAKAPAAKASPAKEATLKIPAAETGSPMKTASPPAANGMSAMQQAAKVPKLVRPNSNDIPIEYVDKLGVS